MINSSVRESTFSVDASAQVTIFFGNRCVTKGKLVFLFHSAVRFDVRILIIKFDINCFICDA